MAVEGSGPEAAVSEFVQRRPAPALRPYVLDYSGYREAGVPPALHRGLPSPSITLILTLDDPLTMLDEPGGSRRDFDALVGGLHTSPAFIHHDGRQSGIQISLKPLGARALLGMPGGELTRIDLPAAEVLGRGIGVLRERLRDTPSWAERFTLIDDALTDRIDQRCPAPEISRAWDLLAASRGRASIEAISHEVGWSSRYLRLRFGVETGLSPRSLARVMRFDRARRLLRPRAAGGPVCLAELAAACGYADQSHLTREFGQLAGLSPTAWLRSEFRSVQDIDTHQGAPSPS